MGKYYVRVCYRNGIAKEENKVLKSINYTIAHGAEKNTWVVQG